MIAPRWISEAIDVAYDNGPGDGKLAAALIERLPIEAMIDAIAVLPSTREACISLVAKVAHVLTDGDPEVVELTELYQDACRALDEAGVPYAIDVEVPASIMIESTIGDLAPHKPAEVREVPAHPGSLQMGLPDRIRWLVSERPTRLELQRVEAERDQLRTMYECASDDLDRARSAHQEADAAASNREIKLTVDLETARAELQRERGGHLAVDAVLEVRDARVTTLEDGIRSLVESDLPAGDLRCALARLIGVDDRMMSVAATDRQVLRAKVADQAAYIESLELEIDALEDEIWEDEP